MERLLSLYVGIFFIVGGIYIFFVRGYYDKLKFSRYIDFGHYHPVLGMLFVIVGVIFVIAGIKHRKK